MPPVPVSEQFGITLAELSRLWRRKLDDRLRPLGLSQAKWITLLQLSLAPKGTTQKDLAERIGIEGPTLVGLLDRLEADGWVERHESTTDRRSKTVHLSDRANPVLAQIRTIAAALRGEIFADVADEDLGACYETLLCLKARLERL
ncbi:MAG: MarR family transcriptional regulator [Betaproteobacteria bacterium]|nr:MarR family transcriptional regulator [Betaproteobacteria bacterium]